MGRSGSTAPCHECITLCRTGHRLVWTAAALVVLVAASEAARRERRQHHRSSSPDAHLLGFRWTSTGADASFAAGTGGSSALLNCAFETRHHEPRGRRVEWRKDGVPVVTGANLRLLANHSLLVRQVGVADEAIYQCAVHLETPSALWTYLSPKTSIKLPRLVGFLQEPVDRSVVRGQPVAFACLVDAFPPARVRWFHNGTTIKELGGDVHVLPRTQTLEIRSVQARHAGEYYCTAQEPGNTNANSKTSRTATLVVQQDESDDSRLEAVLEPRDARVHAGEEVLLECLVNGRPRPDMRWLKNGDSLTIDGRHVKRVGAASLLISDAKPEDRGLYTCRASNVDDALDLSANVQVQVAPTITHPPVDKVAQETADVEMECVANGEPTPSIAWLKNGEALIASPYFVIEPTRLRVLGLVAADQGVYECVAESEAGPAAHASAQLVVERTISDSSASVELQPAPEPSPTAAGSGGTPKLASPPLSLKATAVASRFATLSWDAPLQKHGNILAYHVIYREQTSTRERTANTSGTQLTLAALQPSTTYLVRVAAETEAGLGGASEALTVTTKREQAVPGKVQNLRVWATGAETLEARWEPPSAGPAPLRYRLFYIRAGEDAEEGEKETQVTTTEPWYVLHGMDKWTDYAVRVEADGEHGAGLSSDPIRAKTFSDVPGVAPGGVRVKPQSTTALKVEWQSVDAKLAHGLVSGYKVKYKERKRGSKVRTVVAPGSDEEILLTGLDPHAGYQIRVAVVNQNGTGPFSEWTNADTGGSEDDGGGGDAAEETQLAGAPIGLRAKAGHDHIVVSWRPPSDTHVAVRGYQIGWGINIPDVDFETVGADQRRHKIVGLRPDREYVVSLRASNAAGLGFPIYETVRTIPLGQKVRHSDDEEDEDDEHVDDAFRGFGEDESHDDSSSFAEPADSEVGRLRSPVAVRALVRSSTVARVEWIDPEADEDEDEDAIRSRTYTVRFTTPVEAGGAWRYANASGRARSIDIADLRPATEYEFAVRSASGAGRHSGWSMAVRNRTLSAAPSSAPRDLSVLPAASGDPSALTVHWQPPKHANGLVEEYLIYYTDRPSSSQGAQQDTSDWTVAYVGGDRLSLAINNLIPQTTYYFKAQARNELGYGPMSGIVAYRASAGGGGGGAVQERSDGDFSKELERWKRLYRMAAQNPLYALVAGAALLLALLALVLLCVCISKRAAENKGQKQQQQQGKRRDQQARQQPPDALWLNRTGTTTMADLMVSASAPDRSQHLDEMQPMIHHHLHQQHPHHQHPSQLGQQKRVSPPPRYVSVPVVDVDDVIAPPADYAQPIVLVGNSARRRASMRMAANNIAGPSRAPLALSEYAPSSEASASSPLHNATTATLSRSYADGTGPRTPKVVYASVGRIQNAAAVSSSPYGSQQALSASPPASIVPGQQMSGVHTLRRGTPNPLKSFTSLAGPPPPLQQSVPATVTAPLLVTATPTGGTTPRLGTTPGTARRDVPIGRAAAQPRVNVADVVYAQCNPGGGGSSAAPSSPSTTDPGEEKARLRTGAAAAAAHEPVPPELAIRPASSTDELNAQMASLDTMIDNLHAMQQEFVQ